MEKSLDCGKRIAYNICKLVVQLSRVVIAGSTAALEGPDSDPEPLHDFDTRLCQGRPPSVV